MKRFFALILICWLALPLQAEVILQESFEYGNTDLTTPVGWVAGEQSWLAGHFDKDHNRTAHQGDWYMFTDQQESWIYMPIDVILGIHYNITFWTIADGSFNLELKGGERPDSEAMNISYLPSTVVEDASYQQISCNFVGNTNGTIYLGFHSIGAADAWYLTVDDLTMSYISDYDFIVEAVTPDTMMYHEDQGVFRYKITNTGFEACTLTLSASHEFFADAVTKINGQNASSVTIPEAEHVDVEVWATLPSSIAPNSVLWLDAFISSTHNCHTGLATFWVTPKEIVTLFPLMQPFDQETDLEGWAMRNAADYGWELLQEGETPQCLPYNNTEAMLGYRSSLARTDEKAYLYSPKLSFNSTNNKLQFGFYRTDEMSDKEDLINVYLAPHASLENAQLLATIHRCTSLSPETNETGWIKYEFLFDCSYENGYLIFEGVSDNGMDMFLDEMLIQGQSLSVADADEIDLSLYPNPVEDRLTVEGVEIESLRIADITGRIVYSSDKLGLVEKISLDLSSLKSGLYLMEINNASNKVCRPFVKR